MKTNDNNETDIHQILGIDEKKPILKRKLFWMILFFIVLIPVVGFFLMGSSQSAQPRFKMEEIQRGELTVTISATGTLEPVNQVEVGTEVSGTVKTVEVDYNQRITAGQVLARLDASKLEAQVLQSEAALASAKAKLLEAKANVFKTQKELGRLRKTWKLTGGKAPSQSDLDAGEASLKSAEAQEAVAEALIDQEKALLDSRKTDLGKAIIVSPIDGIVLQRDIEPGQTVAASYQTPVLFTLAENLTQMELHVNVDEADVGQVTEGQSAVFTVDAFPNRKFEAIITQVRFAPQTENGVVTYETILLVDNSDLLLRPGMTATADITVSKVVDALLAPNAALRFKPALLAQNDSNDKEKRSGGFLSKLMPGPPRLSRSDKKRKSTDQSNLWTLNQGQLEPVSVELGVSDGTMTEVKGEGIEPGLPVIVDIIRVEQK